MNRDAIDLLQELEAAIDSEQWHIVSYRAAELQALADQKRKEQLAQPPRGCCE